MVELSIIVYTTTMFLMVLCLHSKGESVIISTKSTHIASCKKILVASLIFSIVFGLRFDVGYDYLSYLHYYLDQEGGAGFEISFRVITNILRTFNVPFIVYFGLFAFVQIYCFLYTYKTEKDLLKYLVFFIFTDAFFLFWMNGIRQGCASSIWLLSLPYLADKDIKKYIIVCLVSMTIHTSAVFLILIYPIISSRRFMNVISISAQISLLLIALIFHTAFGLYLENAFSLVSSISSLMGGLYDVYTDRISFGEDSSTSFGASDYLRLGAVLIAILHSYKMRLFYNSKLFSVTYSLFFWGTVILYIIPHGTVFHRLFIYFEVFRPIMYACLCNYLFRTKKKILGILIIIGFFGLFIMRQVVADIDDHSLYQFVFHQII